MMTALEKLNELEQAVNDGDLDYKIFQEDEAFEMKENN